MTPNLTLRAALRSLTAGGLLIAVPAFAGVNKCTGADGKVVYTEAPCDDSQKATSIRTPPPAPVSVAPQSPATATSAGGRMPPKNDHCRMLEEEIDKLNDKIKSKPTGDMAAAGKSQELRARFDRYCIDHQANRMRREQQAADNLRRQCEGTRNESIPELERGLAELTDPKVATPRYEMIGKLRKLIAEQKRFLAEKCR